MELVARRGVGEVEVVAEVRREAGRAGEDRQREARDDLARAQRDHEERVDQRDRRARERGHADRRREREPGARVQPLHRPEAHHRADEHHPLDAEVEHARALGEQLAERRVQERRPVRDAGREHDDEQRVVHAAGSVRGAAVRPKRTR